MDVIGGEGGAESVEGGWPGGSLREKGIDAGDAGSSGNGSLGPPMGDSESRAALGWIPTALTCSLRKMAISTFAGRASPF